MFLKIMFLVKTFDGMQVVVEVDPDNSDKENPSFLSCGVCTMKRNQKKKGSMRNRNTTRTTLLGRGLFGPLCTNYSFRSLSEGEVEL